MKKVITFAGIRIFHSLETPEGGTRRIDRFAAYLDGSLRRLVHHRSTSSDYWTQPKASVSTDGSLVVWSSDWGETGAIDVYVLENLTLID